MARSIPPAGKRFFLEYYSDHPLPKDIYLQTYSRETPFQETRLRVNESYPPYSIYPAAPAIPKQWRSHQGYVKGLEDCSLFEHPYFSPSYMTLPTNYNTRQPHWTDSRRTKDWLAHWGNELVRNDRAFGKWHNTFGHHYGYGNNRRL